MKKLYVGNLSFKATEDQVQALFSEIGVQPDSLTLLRDRFTGQPRGFGFAEVGDDAEAEKAIAALNGKDFLGRALVVNEARPQREGGGGGGGGPWDWIFSSSVLQWVADPRKVFATWRDRLAPGGRILGGLFAAGSLPEWTAVAGELARQRQKGHGGDRHEHEGQRRRRL